ncbi:isochorismatase family protein [Verminephrobacter aporrectodeae subsp. tuberculatae]|nr:isochorismatase family protein [Verminephrobacter aporrectodeae subsp. tuberculatae]
MAQWRHQQALVQQVVHQRCASQGHAVPHRGGLYYSCFSSPAFSQFVQEHAAHEFVVIGYGTSMCCLSTIVDGYHRGYRFALVEDACAARAVRAHSEAAMHQYATLILERFARITRTAQEAPPSGPAGRLRHQQADPQQPQLPAQGRGP